MLQVIILPATSCSIVILFSCFLVIVTNPRFGVSAFIPISIGQESVIPPHEIAATPVWQTSSPMPISHPGYIVTNVGNSAIRASLYWKDSGPLQTDDVFCEARSNCSSNSSVNVWYELADPVHIEPSESAVIKPSSKAYYNFTRLVVVSNHPENSSNLESIVNVEYEDGGAGLSGSPKKKRDIANSQRSVAENLKDVFKMGGSKLPLAIAVSGMDALIELFWPENKTSVWDEVRDQVRNLIDTETFYAINILLSGRLMGVKRKLMLLATEIKERRSDVSSHYMNLAQDFIGLEEEAIIRGHNNSKKLNEDLLPIYSNIILMKAAFYSLSIKCHQRVGLTQKNLANLKTYFTDMIRSPTHGANQRISEIFRNQSDQATKYNTEMFLRNKIKNDCYIPIWNNMLDQPGQKLVIDETLYEYFMGTYYPDKDVFPPWSIDPLSSAGLSKGKYNEIQTLIIYQSYNACVNCCPETIVGMKLILKYGDTFAFGKITHVYMTIELNGAYRIREIELASLVDGNGMANLRISLVKLNENEWKNSVEENYQFGCHLNNALRKFIFGRKNYYISSVYAFFHFPSPKPDFFPLLHMGVSYLPLKSHLDNTVDEKIWKEWTC